MSSREDFIAALRELHPWPKEKPALGKIVHGWKTHGPKMKRLAPAPELVLEVGTWVGKGTLEMLGQWPEATIVTMDHFRGGPEHQPGQAFHHPDVGQLLERARVNLWPHRARTIVMQKDSDLGFLELMRMWQPEHRGAAFDLIYIDGGHHERQVYRDVAAGWWLQMLQGRDGILCGDDYEIVKAPNGVRKSVDSFGANLGLDVKHDGRFWWYERRAS